MRPWPVVGIKTSYELAGYYLRLMTARYAVAGPL